MRVPLPVLTPSLLSPLQSGPSPPLVGQRASGGPVVSVGVAGSLGVRQLSFSTPSLEYLPLSSSGSPPSLVFLLPPWLFPAVFVESSPSEAHHYVFVGCEAQPWTAPSSLGTTCHPLALTAVHVFAVS